MKRYHTYKDSGVEWIGEVPEHWEVKRLKYVATINPSKENSKISKDSDELVTFGNIDNLFAQGRDVEYIAEHFRMDLAPAWALRLSGKTDQTFASLRRTVRHLAGSGFKNAVLTLLPIFQTHAIVL